MRSHPVSGITLLLIASSLSLRSETYGSWSAAWFSPADRSAGLASPLADPDHDRCLNLAEYWAGTSPLDNRDGLDGDLAMAPAADPEIHYPHDPAAIDSTGVFLVSDDLASWHEQGPPLQVTPTAGYQLYGYHFAKLRVHPAPGAIFDSDSDGLDDFFEERLIASDPHDAFTSLADILPGADFDANGTPNLDEPANGPATPGEAKPPLLDPGTVDAALAALGGSGPAALQVHTPLQ